MGCEDGEIAGIAREFENREKAMAQKEKTSCVAEEIALSSEERKGPCCSKGTGVTGHRVFPVVLDKLQNSCFLPSLS